MGTLRDPEAVFLAVRAGILVTDAGGSVSYANPRASALLGIPEEELRNRTVEESIPAVAPAVRRCLETGAVQSDCMVDEGDLHIMGEVAPIREAGEFVGTAFTFRDLEDLDRAAKKLRSYRDLYRELSTIFDLSHDGLWIFDGAGRIANLNQAAEKLNGIRASDLIGHQVEDLVASGVIDASVTMEVLRTKNPVSMVQRARRTGKHLLVTGTPSFDEEGRISFIVVNDRDMTEMTALTQQLEEAQRVTAKVRDELATLSALERAGEEIVAESGEMREVLRVALRLASMGVSNILLLGESGTGKGKLARFLHQNSERQSKPFVQINCAALPETLLEAELFGYEKGAFTGAKTEGKAGLIEVADGGTLFLDEIGDTPFSVQAKLLKYLDDREIRRIGGTKTKVVDCTIVAATNHDLWSLVEQKRFRHDLYYRLNTFTIKLPPLRERRDDILSLAQHFLGRYNQAYGTNKRLSHGAAEALCAYPFPGNVRELEGTIKNAIVLSESDLLDAYISSALQPPPGGETAPAAEGTRRNLAAELDALERRLLLEAAKSCATTREMADYLGTSQPTVVRKLRRHRIRAGAKGSGPRRPMQR